MKCHGESCTQESTVIVSWQGSHYIDSGSFEFCDTHADMIQPMLADLCAACITVEPIREAAHAKD